MRHALPGSLLAAALLLSACGHTASPAASSSSSASAAAVPLVVYGAVGYGTAVTKAFQDKTGIPVKLVAESTGPLLTKISAEKNNPQWGVFWADGDTAFASLDTQGMLASYEPKVTFNEAGKALQPSSHAYVCVGTTAMGAVIYNAVGTSDVPKSWDDLKAAPYKDKVGMNDPAQSGPTYPLIAGIMDQRGGQSGGEQAGKDYFTALKANGLKVFNTNKDTIHALETGQINYGLIQSSAAIGEVMKNTKKGSFEPTIVYPPKATLLPSAIGIAKKASPQVQDEARRFIDYVLSPEAQEIMKKADTAGDSNYWPLVDGVQANSTLPALPAYQRVDPYFWGPKQSEVTTWFDESIKS